MASDSHAKRPIVVERRKEKGRKKTPRLTKTYDVKIIPATVGVVAETEEPPKKRVAAYCRVSTDQEAQETSLEEQMAHFNTVIAEHPDWELAGIYADEGISGTQVKHRVQFQQMIEDAKAKKIDLILTKSISRFARNVVDCLTNIRLLRNLRPPVSVYFDKERLDSLDEKAEVFLTMLASFAQEESRSISTNIKWATRSRMKAGTQKISTTSLLGYDTDDDGEMVIVTNEAEIVRTIYMSFDKGMHPAEIAEKLNALEIRTIKNNPWTGESVKNILRNEKYCGDLIQKKTYTPDYLTHEKKYNHGKEPLVELKDHHEAIIDRETWQAVQRELSRRNRATGCGGHGNRYPLSGKIRCGECGKSFSHRTKKRQDGSSYYRWCCFTATNEGLRRTDGAGNTIGCSVGRQIRDDIAMDLLRRSVNTVTLDKNAIISSLIRVVESVLASGEDSGEQELRRLELELEKLQARNDTIHDRFFDESITKADYQRAKARCENEMNRVQEKIAAIKQRQTLNTDTQTLKPDIRAAITGIVSGRTADDDFYGHLLQQMTVYRDGRVEVALNLLPAKWVYVLDGLEKYRAKIGGHDASSVPMSVSSPLSSG